MKKDNEINVTQMIDALVKNGLQALNQFMNYDQEKIDIIVQNMALAAVDNHSILAKEAFSETGRGVYEDKQIKNLFAAEYTNNHLRKMKTVGIIEHNEVSGIQYIAEPVGVICGVTPTTNPTSTVIFKSLIAIKTRNPIIFAFHPSAQKSSKMTAQILRDAAIAFGAPENCIQWVETPSIDATNSLMQHPGVATILATGGNAMVRAAYSCGKPALGVGAGNVPSFIEKTAQIDQAVNDVMLSKSFDNGMICASEQAIIIDDLIYDETVTKFKENNMYFVNKKEKALLESFVFGEQAGSKNCAGAKLNSKVVGMPATWIAKEAGFEVPKNIQVLAAECSKVGVEEPLTREKLSPVIAVLKAKNTEHGIKLSEEMVEFDGLGHSAAIHTEDNAVATEFGKRVKAMRILWNSPSSQGGIGGLYNHLVPSLTLGCGSIGRNSVSENVNAQHLLNIKRIAKRSENMLWFKVPYKVYIEPNSIHYLQSMNRFNRVFVVTDTGMVNFGYLDKVLTELRGQKTPPLIQIFSDVEPDPSVDTVMRGAKLMQQFEPDLIVALGGGSPMDAAKGMMIFYEHPELEFNDLKQKFIDIRKRSFKFPKLHQKAELVCIPTTSGTGSEVTPFTVITDKKENKKYPIADYELTPDVAIIDSTLTMSLPSSVTADTGMDVLTHATEAYVSVLASDYTDSLALQAIKMVFDYLPRAVENGKNDAEAREKMHNASTIAGMAFANAFLGINHSIAHKIGGEFHVPHGRTNAIIMPHVIRFNGSKPQKRALFSNYKKYVADERYQTISKMLGLPASTPAEGVESFAKACHDLAISLGIKMSFKDQGIIEKDYMAAAHELAENAFQDQCTTANPRFPLVSELEEIIIKSYK